MLRLLALIYLITLASCQCSLSEANVMWTTGQVACDATTPALNFLDGDSQLIPAYKVLTTEPAQAYSTGSGVNIVRWPKSPPTAEGVDGCTTASSGTTRVACVGVTGAQPGRMDTLTLSGNLSLAFRDNTFVPGTVRSFPIFRAPAVNGFFSFTSVDYGIVPNCLGDGDISFEAYTTTDVLGITWGIRVTTARCGGSTFAPTTSAAGTASPTNAPTQDAATGSPTNAPTQAAATGSPTTRAPTQAGATAAPTQATAAPTTAPTRAPTQAGATASPTTRAPTQVGATPSPTTAPTQAPTSAPTQVGQTVAPTSAPTRAPTQVGATPAPTAAGTTAAPTTSNGVLHSASLFVAALLVILLLA